MTKRLLFILLLSYNFGLFVNAQEVKKEDRLVSKASANYENYSFSPAIDIFKKVIDKGYVSAELLQKLGNSYYYNAEYNEAADTYKKLVNNYSSEVTPEYYFRYAQTLKTLGEYDEADLMMSKFSEATANDNRARVFKEEKDYLDDIKKNSGRYTLKSFEYNSNYSDFAPSFYEDGIIFSSDRDTGNLARYRHTWNSKDFLDLYKVQIADQEMNSVSKLGKDINTRLHESTSITTKDGQTLYFTRNNYVGGKHVKDEEGVIRLKIYRAILIDGTWAQITELPFNSDSYSVAHPALSPDEKTLFFASDMPGTFGESDIFKTTIRVDGTFSTPENLGTEINTESRETFPFITSEEVLYFASDGHPGLGGLDIFATSIKEKTYTNVIFNIGKPVNSQMDDFTFIFNEENRKGYFASNRPDGRGADDIYSFVENVPIQMECKQEITGTVKDKISNEVLVGATVKVIDENNVEILSTITDADGNYSLALDCNQGNFVRALTQGYVPYEEYLEKSDSKPKIIDFYLEPDSVTAGFGDDLAKLLQLSTIYFDFDKYNIRKDSEVEVQKVIAAMEKYPSLKIKVNSHTDSRGKDSYNLWLSQKRAESTLNYMVSKGISATRLLSEGFGETKLVNKCSNGVRCSQEEHESNRRSEFIILE